MRKFTPNFAKTLPPEAKKVFSGTIYDVYQWPQTMFDGSAATFEMLDRPDTVKIIAIDGDQIIVTHQRQPREDWFYDLPGGRVDAADADELAAAKRELREETGMEFRNWKLIKVEQPFSKIDWLVYTFLATDFVRQGPQHLDNGEEIEVLKLSFPEVEKLQYDAKSRFLEINKRDHYPDLAALLAAPALFQYE